MKIEISSLLLEELYMMYKGKYNRHKGSVGNRLNNVNSSSMSAKESELKRIEQRFIEIHKIMTNTGLRQINNKSFEWAKGIKKRGTRNQDE